MRALAAMTTLLTSAVVAGTALAEGGYYSGPLGTRAIGRGGAFTAKADDVTAVSYNPAGLARLGTTIIQLGNQWSYNSSTFTRAPTLDYGHLQNGEPPLVTFSRATNGSPLQHLDPLFGVASNLGLADWGFALVAFAPSGISKLDFPVDAGQRYMMVSRESQILTYAASAAWKYGDTFGLGATAEWIHVPSLKYSMVIDGSVFAGAGNPVSSELDMLATMKGSSAFTFNAILGAWYRPMPSFELAASGQVVPTNIVTNSTISVQPLGTAIDYVVLSRNGRPANDVTVTLPLPLLFRSGVRYRHLSRGRELCDLELDLEYETWSRVQRFVIDANNLKANSQGQQITINRINIEKRWRDTIALKLGGDFNVVPDRLTVRGGLMYATAVADPAYANVDFLGGAQLGASVGASVFSKHLELAVAYQVRVFTDVTVSERDARVYQQVPGSPCTPPYTDPYSCNSHYLGQPSPAVNAGTYNARSHFLSVDLVYRYGI